MLRLRFLISVSLILPFLNACGIVDTDGFNVDYFEIDSSHITKIIPDLDEDRAWAVLWLDGIALVDESIHGKVRFTKFQIGPITGATGPDDRGFIYLTGYDQSHSTGVYVFDSAKLQVVDFYPLEDYETARDIELSPDGKKIYVSILGWPVEDYEYNKVAAEPSDDGFILEMDTETMEVSRVEFVGCGAENIYITPDNTILVDTGRRTYLETQDLPEGYCWGYNGSLTDMINLSDFHRANRFNAPVAAGKFFPWSDDGKLVAQCSSELVNLSDHQEYLAGLWIYDCEKNAVADTVLITDELGGHYGTVCGAVSRKKSDTVYLSTTTSMHGDHSFELGNQRFNFMSINKLTGEVIRGIKLTFLPEAIYQYPDGKILLAGKENIVALITPLV